MELECKCYSLWHAEDDCERVTKTCPIHGPNGTKEAKAAYLKSEHFRIKAARQEEIDELKAAINDALYGGEDTLRVADGIVAALLWVRDKNDGRIPNNPINTYERRELIRSYGVDPEDDND